MSPRLGIRFDLVDEELRLSDPAGVPFATYVELVRMRDEQRRRADEEHQRAARLAARLKALGEDPGD